jgi:hypothetical protein
LIAQTHIGYVYPAGGQKGTSFEVVVGGQSIGDVTGVYVNGEGVTGTIVEKIPVDIKAKNLRTKEQDIPQLEEMVKVKISIDKKAAIGMRDFRLVSQSGFTNRIFFEVNELPEYREAEPNDSPSNAFRVLKLPAVVNGQIMPGERDCFRFSATKGQTIVCQTKARRLVPYLPDAVPGWFQPVLTLRDEVDKEVAFNDDFGGNPDPVIICIIPRTGEYTLEIKDAVYRGREDFVYRISIGEIPFIRSIYPLGGQIGVRTKVSLDGVNLSKNQIKINPKKNSAGKINLTEKGKGLQSNEVSFATTTNEELTENENNGFSNPMAIPVNYTVNGMIQKPGEEDWYRFDGKKGESVVVEILAHRLGSLLDAEITLYDTSNKVLAQVDDTQDRSEGLETFHADPQMLYKIAKKGKIFIRIRDVSGKGGTAYGYRLSIGRPSPDFDLRINPSNLVINQEGTASFTVYALRKYNFMGEINLKLSGLPSGYSYSSSTIKKGQSQLRMTVSAPPQAKMGALDLNILGISEANGEQVERKAEPVEELMQAFFYQHLLPTSDFLATVTPPLPFRISHSIPTDSILTFTKEKGISFKVKVERKADFNLPVQLILDNPPKGVRMKPVIVPVGENEAMVTIETGLTGFGQGINLVMSGVGRIQKTKKSSAKVYKALSPAFMVEIPKRSFR